MDKKPLLASRTIITAVILFVINRFLPSDAVDAIRSFLAEFEEVSSVTPVDLLIALFVFLRIITHSAVDLAKWIDVKAIYEKLRFLILLLIVPTVLLCATSCQSLSLPSLDRAPDGDLRACFGFQNLGPLDLTICADPSNRAEPGK